MHHAFIIKIRQINGWTQNVFGPKQWCKETTYYAAIQRNTGHAVDVIPKFLVSTSVSSPETFQLMRPAGNYEHR